MSINTIIIIALVMMTIIGLGVCLYLYVRNKSLEDIRTDVYQLFIAAEHTFLETGSGRQKMKYVISRARSMLPGWLQAVITEPLLERVIQGWFTGIKDLLDDGKLNSSVEEDKNE